MDELTALFGSISRLMMILGGGISTVTVCYAGILWMTSSGDPQNMSKARMALMGSVGGLIIVGVAFIVPRIISDAVIEPIGGNVMGTESGQNCDDVLRNQFVFQRNASTASHLNAVISQLQNQRSDQCAADVWDPLVLVSTAKTGTTVTDGGCEAHAKVGGADVPSGLHRGGSTLADNARVLSGRDRDNNIIIHWASTKRPTDNARCWMYTARLNTWSVE